RDAAAPAVDPQPTRPDRAAGPRVDVHPHQRGGRRREQDRGASRLRPQELPQRGLEASRPGGPSGEASSLRAVRGAAHALRGGRHARAFLVIARSYAAAAAEYDYGLAPAPARGIEQVVRGADLVMLGPLTRAL